MANYRELDTEEKNLLSWLAVKFGRKWKELVRHAWETGDYSALGLRENDDQRLQFMRNSLGPSWLWGLKGKDYK